MDAFGAFVNVSALVERIIKTYRHIAASKSFATEAANLAVKISFEYFRFETWAEQSRYLVIDDGPISTTSSHISSPPISKSQLQLVEKINEIVNQISLVLQEISTLLARYNMLEPLTETGVPSTQHQNVTQLPTSATGNSPQRDLAISTDFAVSQGVRTASEKHSRLRLRLDRETGRLRKINFDWSLRNELSDKKRLQEFIDQLTYWNDGLRETMPTVDQRFNEVVSQVRVVSLANDQADCEGIEKSSKFVDGVLYNDIQFAAKMKGQKLHSDFGAGEGREVVLPINMSLVPRFREDCRSEIDYSLTTICGEHNDGTRSRRIVVERVDFGKNLGHDSLTILENRIKQLTKLLKENPRPTSLLLPICEGFLKPSPSEFAVLYHLPLNADPIMRPRSLFSLLPANTNSPKRPSREAFLPTLEERYCLAKLLAEGMLVLHNINWVHKNFNSNNVVFFHDDEGFGISKPLMLGFGLGRSSERTAETVDLRHVASEFEIYQHPDLRVDGHKRYEKRYDIYSLGLVLLEIGLWQSVYYFKQKNQDAQEFRRAVLNVCETHLAHFMGKSYQRAIRLCIMDDEIWKESADDDDAATRVQEIFTWKVLKELSSCL